MRHLALLLALAACRAVQPAGPDADTVVVDTDVDTIDTVDTDPADSDAADTIAAHTDPPAETDARETGLLRDTEPPGDDPPVDTAVPLAEAVDGPFVGRWAARGGSRLELVRLALAGTDAASFVYFHDRQLDVDCAFTVAEDGRLRCLPVPVPLDWAQEAGCGRAGKLVPDTCAATVARVGATGPSCGFPRAGVRTLRRDPSVTTIGQTFEGGGCGDEPVPEGQGFARLGARLAPWRYVRGVALAVPTGGDVDVLVVRGADGAVQPVGLYDPARDVPCVPRRRVDDPPGVALCAPFTDVTPLPGPYHFGHQDDACDVVTEVTVDVCDDEAPDLGLDLDGPAFREGFPRPLRYVDALRELGAPVLHGFTWVGWWSAPPQCLEVDYGGQGSWGPMRALGDELGPDDLPTLVRATLGDAAGGVDAWTDADGRALLPVADGALVGPDGVPCVPVWDATATRAACVASSDLVLPDTEDHFLDPACTEPILAVRSEAPEGLVTLRVPWGGECFGAMPFVPRDAHPVVLGEQVEPEVIYSWQWTWFGAPLECLPTPNGLGRYWDEPREVWRRYTVDAHPLSTWPEVALR